MAVSRSQPIISDICSKNKRQSGEQYLFFYVECILTTGFLVGSPSRFKMVGTSPVLDLLLVWPLLFSIVLEEKFKSTNHYVYSGFSLVGLVRSFPDGL